ncbi:MAG TPA: HEPN domain-containing protein [Roseiarcus sp.]|nr:HEPN domain-containing protein [Roseiarcus sp.]
MTPQAARFLDKAQKLLAEAEVMIGAGLADAAGRTAYLAAFHAAQALIFERIGKTLKSHTGVHAEFLRLTKDDSNIGELRAFLSRAYNLKSLADYETGPDSEISPDRAAKALAEAKRFVAFLGDLIGG